MVQRMERDAEVDALKARLAAAEARAERAEGLLVEAIAEANAGRALLADVLSLAEANGWKCAEAAKRHIKAHPEKRA